MKTNPNDGKLLEDKYLVTPRGEVYSLVFTNGKTSKPRSKPLKLKQSLGTNGYLYISICKKGKAKTVYIHKLVASLFVSGKKDGLIVGHKDGNRLNNHYENLKWITYRENQMDRFEHGTSGQGKGHKLNESLVREILANKTDKQIDIARKYKISRDLVMKIQKGILWKHVTAELNKEEK